MSSKTLDVLALFEHAPVSYDSGTNPPYVPLNLPNTSAHTRRTASVLGEALYRNFGHLSESANPVFNESGFCRTVRTLVEMNYVLLVEAEEKTIGTGEPTEYQARQARERRLDDASELHRIEQSGERTLSQHERTRLDTARRDYPDLFQLPPTRAGEPDRSSTPGAFSPPSEEPRPVEKKVSSTRPSVFDPHPSVPLEAEKEARRATTASEKSMPVAAPSAEASASEPELAGFADPKPSLWQWITGRSKKGYVQPGERPRAEKSVGPAIPGRHLPPAPAAEPSAAAAPRLSWFERRRASKAAREQAKKLTTRADYAKAVDFFGNLAEKLPKGALAAAEGTPSARAAAAAAAAKPAAAEPTSSSLSDRAAQAVSGGGRGQAKLRQLDPEEIKRRIEAVGRQQPVNLRRQPAAAATPEQQAAATPDKPSLWQRAKDIYHHPVTSDLLKGAALGGGAALLGAGALPVAALGALGATRLGRTAWQGVKSGIEGYRGPSHGMRDLGSLPSTGHRIFVPDTGGVSSGITGFMSGVERGWHGRDTKPAAQKPAAQEPVVPQAKPGRGETTNVDIEAGKHIEPWEGGNKELTDLFQKAQDHFDKGNYDQTLSHLRAMKLRLPPAHADKLDYMINIAKEAKEGSAAPGAGSPTAAGARGGAAEMPPGWGHPVVANFNKWRTIISHVPTTVKPRNIDNFYHAVVSLGLDPDNPDHWDVNRIATNIGQNKAAQKDLKDALGAAHHVGVLDLAQKIRALMGHGVSEMQRRAERASRPASETTASAASEAGNKPEAAPGAESSAASEPEKKTSAEPEAGAPAAAAEPAPGEPATGKSAEKPATEKPSVPPVERPIEQPAGAGLEAGSAAVQGAAGERMTGATLTARAPAAQPEGRVVRLPPRAGPHSPVAAPEGFADAVANLHRQFGRNQARFNTELGALFAANNIRDRELYRAVRDHWFKGEPIADRFAQFGRPIEGGATSTLAQSVDVPRTLLVLERLGI